MCTQRLEGRALRLNILAVFNTPIRLQHYHTIQKVYFPIYNKSWYRTLFYCYKTGKNIHWTLTRVYRCEFVFQTMSDWAGWFHTPNCFFNYLLLKRLEIFLSIESSRFSYFLIIIGLPKSKVLISEWTWRNSGRVSECARVIKKRIWCINFRSLLMDDSYTR